MPCTNPQNPNCPNCNKSGLAILPVRYAVVPKSVEATLPAPLGNKVSDVKLSQHKYALRTLRQGYLYVFHEKHPRGSHIKWEVYSVSAAGTLWKQLSPEAMKPVEEEPACSRSGHNIPASVITIESPEKCKRVWIAFSEHAWSKETFEDFAKDAKLRDRRMQTFLPATWVSAGGYRHGLPATRSNIEQAIEYQPAFKPDTLNGGAVPRISDKNGVHMQRSLDMLTTSHPAVARTGQSERLAKTMQQISQDPKGKDHTPVMIALWDAVGIAHELNGYYNETMGWVEKYNAEQDLQVSAMMSIVGLKKALSEKAVNEEQASQQLVIDRNARRFDTAGRRLAAAKLPPAQRAKELEVCNILDDWQRRKVPTDAFIVRLNRTTLMEEPERSAEIADIKRIVEEVMARRQESAGKNVEKARANAWEKYDDQLAKGKRNKKLYEDFKENYDKFLAAATRLTQERATDLVAWLESRYLVDALSEYHGDSFVDGMAFDTHVGMAIFGMQASDAGQKKLDSWIKELRATDHNLLWRSIALNQTAGFADLDKYLAEANQHAKMKTPAGSIDWPTTISKSLKAVVDTYKKFVSFSSSNTDAASEKGSKAFDIKLKSTNFAKGADRVVLTAGERIFGQFRLMGLADYASEKLIQHLFGIRSLMTPKESLELIKVQVANEATARAQMLAVMRDARKGSAAAAAALKTRQTEALRKAWAKFNATDPKAPSAMRDARLALLIMLIEGVNFNKLLNDCLSKNDTKSWASLIASSMTISSALLDVATVPMKALAKGKAESFSFQRLKLLGGVLGASASFVTALLDREEAIKKFGQGQDLVGFLYVVKSVVGVSSMGVTLATTFTYSAPAVGRILGVETISTAAGLAGSRVAAFIAMRILFMSAGAWITVLAFAIQGAIWIFSKNELEIWCARCAFGVDRLDDKRFNLKEQTDGLEKALIEMGLAPAKEEKVTTEQILAQPRPSVDEMMMHD